MFWYDEKIGQLRRKVQTSSRAILNSVAGTIMQTGYRIVSIDYKLYLAHRIIWTMLKGPIPDGYEIDHINGKRDDNHLANLRLATGSENGFNMKRRLDNTSGVKGVSFHKLAGMWDGRVNANKKCYRSMFATKEEAELFVRETRERLHVEFTNHGL